jgi:glutamate-1-semialdehyde aminotransferase
MATALRMVELLRADEGRVLQELNDTTTAFCQRQNDFFRAGGYPVALANFGSLLRFQNLDKQHPLFYQLLQNGVYVWEGRTCFLSPAHDAAVLAELEARIRRSCVEIDAQGLF